MLRTPVKEYSAHFDDANIITGTTTWAALKATAMDALYKTTAAYTDLSAYERRWVSAHIAQ